MAKPKNITSKVPAFIRFHGYTGDSGDWTSLLHYAASGMIAIAMDCRGQGGALTLACVALEPRIARLVPVFPFLSDYKRVWDMDLAINAYSGIREYFRHFDPNHEREEVFFQTLGYIDIQNLASRIRGEVLFAVGLMDNICPPSSQFACYNKITAPKSYVVYPDFGHEFLPGLGDKELSFLLR